MKKSANRSTQRTLSLSRETLRRLSSAELTDVAGGSLLPNPPAPTHHVTCTVHLQE